MFNQEIVDYIKMKTFAKASREFIAWLTEFLLSND